MDAIAMVPTVFANIKTAMDIVKILRESNLSLGEAENKLKLAELMSTLADVKIEVVGLQDLILEKDRKIKELEQTLTVKKNICYEKPFYWMVDGEKKDGPFCQTCYDSNEKLIRLQIIETGHWICNICKNLYKDSSYKSSKTTMISNERISAEIARDFERFW
ncbi:MAG TPA: hypothetical protein VK186_03890 [Candidatus Deferrimicrobium sp.]|nr:hypothetical protein [Candidatus Deferrimicrobium sp.]